MIVGAVTVGTGGTVTAASKGTVTTTGVVIVGAVTVGTGGTVTAASKGTVATTGVVIGRWGHLPSQKWPRCRYDGLKDNVFMS